MLFRSQDECRQVHDAYARLRNPLVMHLHRRCHPLETVSYTHLDVYKRQGSLSGTDVLVMWKMAFFYVLRFDLDHELSDVGSVSYTHLDVYKRQA